VSGLAVITLAAWVAGVGVLAFSVAAKLADWAATVARWPVSPSRLGGPLIVTMAEAGVVLAAVAPVVTAPRFWAVAALYGGYAVASIRLRGRDRAAGILPRWCAPI
jgi:hypothetical protein